MTMRTSSVSSLPGVITMPGLFQVLLGLLRRRPARGDVWLTFSTLAGAKGAHIGRAASRMPARVFPLIRLHVLLALRVVVSRFGRCAAVFLLFLGRAFTAVLCLLKLGTLGFYLFPTAFA